MGYQFEVIYKPGNENKATDALSRIEEVQEFNAVISQPHWLDFSTIKDEIRQDPYLSQLRDNLLSNLAAHLGFALKGDMLFHEGRLVISKTSPLIPTLLQEYHSSPIGGHSGFL